MNASRTAGLCGDTTLAPVAIAITMELVETVFDIFSKIYALAEQAKSNKANCKKAATRCRGIESIVKNCQKEYQRYGGMSDEQRGGFDLLLKHVRELEGVVTKYSKRNFIMRGLKANSFKTKYEEIDKEISTDIQIIQAGLGATTIEQNNDLLDKSKVIMGLDEKMDEALGKLDGINDALRKKSAHEQARDDIKRHALENEILPGDVEFFDFQKCLGRGSFGKVYKIRYVGEMHA